MPEGKGVHMCVTHSRPPTQIKKRRKTGILTRSAEHNWISDISQAVIYLIMKPHLRKQRYVIAGTLLAITCLLYFSVTKLAESRMRPWNLPQEDEPVDIPLDAERRIKNPLMFKTKGKLSITPFAEKTLYVVKLPSRLIWSHLPLLAETVLSEYPNHLVFSDSGAIVSKIQVIDALSRLSTETLTNHTSLDSYRIRRYGMDQDWGWSPDEYWPGDEETLMKMVMEESLTEVKASLTPKIEWVIFADEQSYVSPHAFEEFKQSGNMRFPTDNGNDVLLLSRESVLKATSLQDIEIANTVAANNISETSYNAANWCEPVYAYTDLDRWELQSIFSWEAKLRSTPIDHLHCGFYRDFVLPYIATEKPNWMISPEGPIYTGEYNNEQVTKRMCMDLCEANENCLAWQWSETFECRLETHSIRRGTAMSNLFKEANSEDPLLISGWMLDRIRNIRINAECDPLALEPDGEPNDASLLKEGWWKELRDRAKLEGSDVLKSLEAYEKSLDSSN